MRWTALSPLLLAALLAAGLPCRAGILDDLVKGVGGARTTMATDDQVVAGLKEALTIGSSKGVKTVSKTDGYFGNPAIRILMPEKLQKVADVLGKVGYEKEVDAFVLSMNRAAEKAAPKARAIFVDAIRGMTFDDARKILSGGDTAATEYFRAKTGERMHAAFLPVVSSSMDEVGVTRSYKEMMGRYTSVPFMRAESLDLDQYVTKKALDGLYYMVAQEERKIRTDPAARATDLLRKVFGGR
jgi:hypothetical protein